MMHIFYQLLYFSLFNSSIMSHKAFIAGIKFGRSGGFAYYFLSLFTSMSVAYISVIFIFLEQDCNLIQLLVFAYHVIKSKNSNHSINKVTNKGYDR